MSKYHTAHIIRADEFKDENWQIDAFANGAESIKGHLKKSDSFVAQSYRFDSQIFSAETAKKWLKKNEITFSSFIEAVNEPLEVSEEPEDVIVYESSEMKLGARHNVSDALMINKVHSLLSEAMTHIRALGSTVDMTNQDDSGEELKAWEEAEFSQTSQKE